jgi:hypothetical protein
VIFHCYVKLPEGTLPIQKNHHKITQLWEDPNCDGFLVILTPQAMTAPTDCAVALTKYAKIQGSEDPSPMGPTSPGILPANIGSFW